MSILRLRFTIGFLPLLFLACGSAQQFASVNPQTNKENTNQTRKIKPDSAMIIRQGTVGTVGKFSVGVRNIVDASSARIAIWNSALPQAERNDYNVSLMIKSGDSFLIGNNFYRAIKITADEIQLESEPDELRLQENALAVPAGAILELHGHAVEVVSVDAANGTTSAKIEIYSNDFPKKDLEEKKQIRTLIISPGDEITIGEKRHRAIAVHAGRETSRGVLEISFSAVQ